MSTPALPLAAAAERRALRRQVRAARAALPPDQHREQSARAVQRLLDHALFARAHTLFAYAAHGSELDTQPLLRAALAAGKRLALPRVCPHVPGCLRFHAVRQPATDLRPGAFGILEPRAELPELGPHEADLLLVPGIAFTARGERLGQGGGFYDRFLAHPACRAATVALLFQEQLRPALPLLAHDRRVDWLVTPGALWRAL